MARQPSQRKILLVDPKLQVRYLILPLAVSLTTGACLLALFLIQADSLKSRIDIKVSPALYEQVQSTQLMTVVMVAAVLLGHAALVVWLGLNASHKVAGPVYRLKKVMKQVSAGDLAVRMKLRSGDHLTDVADGFNAMATALENRYGQAGEGAKETAEGGDAFEESLDLPEGTAGLDVGNEGDDLEDPGNGA